MSTSQPDHLKFLYELSEEFCVLPTFIVWKAMSATSGVYTDDKYGINIDPTQVNTRSVSRPPSPSLTHPVSALTVLLRCTWLASSCQCHIGAAKLHAIGKFRLSLYFSGRVHLSVRSPAIRLRDRPEFLCTANVCCWSRFTLYHALDDGQ